MTCIAAGLAARGLGSVALQLYARGASDPRPLVNLGFGMFLWFPVGSLVSEFVANVLVRQASPIQTKEPFGVPTRAGNAI
ncbi:MAG: hypothetical protein IPM17_03650 [Verrucomicrobia bacterium]|nr:hypothetical protein [Verrucomicrobiota bacterium]